MRFPHSVFSLASDGEDRVGRYSAGMWHVVLVRFHVLWCNVVLCSPDGPSLKCDTGQNASLDHEMSQGVKTHLETRITPWETGIFTASDLEKPVGAEMALDLETTQGVKHTFRQEETNVFAAQP